MEEKKVPEKNKPVSKDVKVMNSGIARAHLLTGDGAMKRGSMRPQQNTPRPPPPKGQGGSNPKPLGTKGK